MIYGRQNWIKIIIVSQITQIYHIRDNNRIFLDSQRIPTIAPNKLSKQRPPTYFPNIYNWERLTAHASVADTTPWYGLHGMVVLPEEAKPIAGEISKPLVS